LQKQNAGYMKKIMLFSLLFTLSICFNSCSDDDSDELRADSNFNPVLGEWFGGGTRINEKYIFSVDFKCQKYERETKKDEWVIVSEATYLINKTHIKIGKDEPKEYWLRNFINNRYEELSLEVEDNSFSHYYIFEP